MLVETADSLDCFDLARTTKNFQTKVYGIKVCFQNPEKRKTLIVSAIVDEMVIDCLNEEFIEKKLILSYNKNQKMIYFKMKTF